MVENSVELRFRCRWVLREEETLVRLGERVDKMLEELPVFKYHNTSHVAPVNHTTKSIVDPLLVCLHVCCGVNKI